jgi:hypothetical protein
MRNHLRSTVGGRATRPMLLALAILLAGLPELGTFTIPTAAAADSTSDIPGVPLPGPVAAGRLGGAVYDVVYRLTVSPGYVIVASITGTSGTDFDLYLFDASATTVVADIGLLAASKGPTSAEAISWPSRLGGTYYIDLNGATDVEGDFRLTVQTVPDPTPPIATMTLAAGRPTNDLTVPVTFVASDDLSGVTEMALSSDGPSFAGWQPFQATSSWTFTPGDGPRTLWARVRNGVGLESATIAATAVIDTDPPAPLEFSPAPGSSTVGLLPTFSVSFDEPIDPATWTDLGLIVQSAGGALIGGVYRYDAAAQVGTFVPTAALEAGATYVVTVGDVKDVAGNRVTSPGSWSVVALAASGMIGRADPRVITRGGSSRLSVTLTGASSPATVEVLAATPTSGFVQVDTLSISAGSGSLVVKPAVNTTFRIRYPGTSLVAPSQVDLPVFVRRSVALVGRDATVTARAKVGTTVRLVAAVAPAAPGVSVSFRTYRFDASRRVWVYAGSKGRNTDATGRASYTWTPSVPGLFYWRASVASTTDYANNVSPVYRWSVVR